MAKPIKVALTHLAHATFGRHAPQMPINIGYIGAYTKEHVGAGNIELRLYTDAEKLLVDLATWKPDVLGTSNYVWNSEIGHIMMLAARDDNPRVICVAGGPEIPSQDDERRAYLAKRPEIDFYAYLEGELPFGELVSKLIAGATADELRRVPQDGMLSLHPDTRELIIGPVMPRPMDMDIIPSPYLTGLMDEWFDGSTAPSMETARGCPFSCTFCFQGQKYFSTIAKFSIERIKDELTYIAKRMTDAPNNFLRLYDSNFGMYERDEEIAEHLRSLQDEYGWPNFIDVNTGKANYDRILKIANRVRNKIQISTSVQSINQETLGAIKRKNLRLDQLAEVQRRIKDDELISDTEIIVPLPEETKQSFFNGLKRLEELGIDQLAPYTTMLLKGTPLAEPEIRKKYEMVNKFRLLPRQFGEYKNRRCFEIEEVCVATNTMSFEDYIQCRGIALIWVIFTNTQFDIIRRHLNELGLSVYEFVHSAWQRISDGASALSPIYENYVQECKDELFNSPEEVYEFYSEDKNYRRLLMGDIGDNLIRKFRIETIINYSVPSLQFAYDVFEELACDNFDEESHSSVRAAREWAIASRDLGAILVDDKQLDKVQTLTLDYDVATWYHEGMKARPLPEFHGMTTYKLQSNQGRIRGILDQTRQLFGGDENLWLAKALTMWTVKEFWLESKSEPDLN
jgi:radical SAM superfamily enzyme YgiQ (UPF0313 family)